MEVRPPKNPSCTFSSTGKCNCKKEKTDSKLANETSAQTKEKVKGVVTK